MLGKPSEPGGPTSVSFSTTPRLSAGRNHIGALAGFLRVLQEPLTLELMLQRVVDCAALLLETSRVNIRLLDPTRTRLIAACRHGEPLHWNPDVQFQLGEGLIGWIAQHQKPICVGAAEQDPRFLRRPDMRESIGAYLGMPLMAGHTCVGVLSATHPQKDRFERHHEDLLALLAGLCAPYVEVARLSRLAQTDPLTGALNRRGLAQVLPEVGAIPDDNGASLAVALVDVDHFKHVNDGHGHAVGDSVLCGIAEVLAGVLRANDAVVRYGGEEFLLLLPEVDLATAARIAERARATVAAAAYGLEGANVRVTVSLGVAERRRGESRDQLIRRADAALLAAKRGGRNRVELAAAAE
jgi:diguanylate cyclase (GGDEF)-like protein